MSEGLFFSYKLGQFISDETHEDSESKSQIVDPNKIIGQYHQPTVWQVAFSSDGKYVSTLQSSTLAIYKTNSKKYKSKTIPDSITAQPQSRKLQWDDNNRILIMSPITSTLVIFNSECVVLHIFNLVHITSKSLPRYIFPFQNNKVHIICDIFDIKTCNIAIESKSLQVISEKLNFSNNNNNNNINSNKLDNMLVETVQWNSNSNTLVIVVRSLNKLVATASAFILTFNTQNTTWSILHELILSRGEPFTIDITDSATYTNPNSISVFSQMTQSITKQFQSLSTFSSKVCSQPIINIISNSDDRLVVIYI